MQTNVGKKDQMTRYVIGSALVASGLFGKGAWRWVGGLAGASLLASAATRYCPMNQAMGVNTAENENEDQPGAMAPESGSGPSSTGDIPTASTAGAL